MMQRLGAGSEWLSAGLGSSLSLVNGPAAAITDGYSGMACKQESCADISEQDGQKD